VDLHRPQSCLVDLPSHYYEPGGRTFESCWAHQNFQSFSNLQLAIFGAPADLMPTVT
jgi:hypothetical protein